MTMIQTESSVMLTQQQLESFKTVQDTPRLSGVWNAVLRKSIIRRGHTGPFKLLSGFHHVLGCGYIQDLILQELIVSDACILWS